MSRYVEFTPPDRSTVVIESDDREGGIVKGSRVETLERARQF